jgi:hypothetical protein
MRDVETRPIGSRAVPTVEVNGLDLAYRIYGDGPRRSCS